MSHNKAGKVKKDSDDYDKLNVEDLLNEEDDDDDDEEDLEDFYRKVDTVG